MNRVRSLLSQCPFCKQAQHQKWNNRFQSVHRKGRFSQFDYIFGHSKSFIIPHVSTALMSNPHIVVGTPGMHSHIRQYQHQPTSATECNYGIIDSLIHSKGDYHVLDFWNLTLQNIFLIIEFANIHSLTRKCTFSTLVTFKDYLTLITALLTL